VVDVSFSDGISLLALAVSGVALYFSVRHGKAGVGTSQATWELQIQRHIDDTWRELEAVDIDGKDGEEKFDAARQRALNAYDVGCQAYIDGKIDRERFRRAQERNIARLFDSPKDYPELERRGTDYRAMVQVYESWRGEG